MASSVSTTIFNQLFATYMVIAVLVGGLVVGWLFYAMWKFRARPGDPRPRDAPVPGMIPAERGHVMWVYIMAGGIAAIMFGLAFSTISAVDTLEHPPADVPASYHNVTGFQFGWRFNYTGAGGIPFNKVGEFTVPEDTPIVMNVTSQDVWHNFAIPDYRIRVDSVPGVVNLMWFQANDPAETHVACVQICGAGHAIMRANVHVLPKADYEAWLAKESRAEYERLLKAGRATSVNLTRDGAWTGEETRLAAGRPAVFNVTNAGDAPLEAYLRLAEGARLATITVAPGANGHLYLPAQSPGVVVLGTPGDEKSYRVS